MSTPIKTIEDAREFLSRLCDRRGISGYAIEQGIMDNGWSNASGARHFVQGRQLSITLDTLLMLCEHFKLRLSIEEIGATPKKKPKRSQWNWEETSPAYQRLVRRSEA
tara:strand:- start:287 stop:610 length:324 start_codon:yes stop_codon:yes gene_type:complete